MKVKSSAMRTCKSILGTGILFFSPIAATEDDLTPALLSSGEQSLQSLIEFPDWRGDAEISILCGARLAADGEFLDNYCWGFDRRKFYYIRKIEEVVGDARAIPARLNGENRPVWIQYSVDFRKIGDARSIIVNPNWGLISGEANDKCQTKLAEFVEHAKYMPAVHQGAYVAVKYVDFWFRSSDRWTGRDD
jgi:hypothetical protein